MRLTTAALYYTTV